MGPTPSVICGVPMGQNQMLQVPETETESGEHHVCVLHVPISMHTHAQSHAHMPGPLAVQWSPRPLWSGVFPAGVGWGWSAEGKSISYQGHTG